MGGWLLLIFTLGSSVPPCYNFMILLVGFLVLDSVVPKLNHVSHEKLHLRKTSLVC